MCGDTERVIQELRNSADLTLEYGRFGNVLQAAAADLSWPSRDEVLEILLNNGADANAQGGVYGNALQAVAADPGVSGHRIPALSILLDRGAEVNATGGRYGHALVAAAAMATPLLQEPASIILKFLLDHGANPDAQEPGYMAVHCIWQLCTMMKKAYSYFSTEERPTTLHHEHYGTPVNHAKKLAYGPVWQLLRKRLSKRNTERHVDRVRLSAALKIQRKFRDRRVTNDRGSLSHSPQAIKGYEKGERKATTESQAAITALPER